MRLLLDTHALLWALEGHPALSSQTRELIVQEAEAVFASIASIWEIAIKKRAGKLSLDIAEVLKAISDSGYTLLHVEPRHVIAVSALPVVAGHRDPFDHFLIAQAMVEGLTFVSNDRHAGEYAVPLIRC